MPDGPVDAHDHRVTPVAADPAGAAGAAAISVPRPQTVRMLVKADLLPAVRVLAVVGLLGLPLGGVWALLAPTQKSLVTRTGEIVPVLVEGFHEFDALAIFMLLSAAAGVLTGAALWMLRGLRGPVVLIAAVIGSFVAAWLGMAAGMWFASLMYSVPPSLPAGEIVRASPELHTVTAVLCQPLAMALTYGFAASWNGLDDLGRH